ncbi:MAG: DUF108 domain-containing protein [Alphaproteobacteria bacterium]|nr:DUF108 domain-containing protein [Alphaproteobacteria bacterium]QQS56194.1 MAG: DUF108 domain-containing protein [Alphaproteobacteria bacterium]
MLQTDQKAPLKVGVAGVGAIGRAVCLALSEAPGIDGLILHMISDQKTRPEFDIPQVNFAALAHDCDFIVECLPAPAVPALAAEVFKNGRDMVVISSAALLLFPEILETQKNSGSRIIVPSGALAGLDGVKAMREMGIESSKIASSKPPKGFEGAPYVVDKKIDLSSIKTKTLIFSGNALEASRAFPANVNVAATLSLAGIGPEKTQVEVWADPAAVSNTHEITVKTRYSTLASRIENMPDPANPKSSVLAARSIIAALRDLQQSVVIG